jgi:hypothetical protein
LILVFAYSFLNLSRSFSVIGAIDSAATSLRWN